MDLDLSVAAAGLLVGFTVGMTGMGGGALMTPILVLLFHVQPLAAVSSDLVASVIMKPVGAGVHLRRGTVDFRLVKWLAAGSVPAAFAGVLLLRALGEGAEVQALVRRALGVALLLAAGSIAAKAVVQARATRRARAAGGAGPTGISDGAATAQRPPRVRKLLTLGVGVLGGLVVGMTSVGSGSLVIVLLMLLYPALSSARLVGTDLMQAIPLVGSAALGHLLFGDFKLDLTASLLLGSLPGVYAGAKVSSLAKDAVIRPALALILIASGLKLLEVATPRAVVLVLVVALVALPVWGVLDAVAQPGHAWSATSVSRRAMIGVQGAGALFGVGFVAALVYFGAVRPKLVAVAMAGPTADPPGTRPAGPARGLGSGVRRLLEGARPRAGGR